MARAEERARRRVVVPPKAARHQSARRVVRVAFGHVAPLVNARELEGKIIVFCAVPVRVGADDVPLRDRHQRSDVFHGLVCKPRFRDAAAGRVSERQNDDDDDDEAKLFCQDVGFFFSSSKGAAALGAHTDGPKNSNASTIDTTTITTNTHNSNTHRECVHCQPPVFQPIRAKHCFACNRCVRKFDHHCHWISNCVGEKNHGKFLLFLTTQFIVVSWGLLACLRTFEYYSDSEENSGGVIPRRRRKPSNFAELVANNGWSAFATFLFFLFTVFVGALFFTHWYLVLSARTTYELLAARHKVWYLPRKKTTPPPPPPPPPLREFTRSPFTAGTGCKGAFFNVKRTLCIDSALPHDVGVKWIVPDDAVLAERDAEETCFDNAQYSCC